MLLRNRRQAERHLSSLRDGRGAKEEKLASLIHIRLSQLHILHPVVSLQALNLLPMFLAVQHPAQSAQKADDGQYNGRCRQARFNKLTI